MKDSVALIGTEELNMVIFKLLIFTLIFYEFTVDLDAGITCSKGQRVTRSGTGCESCPIEAFQPEENDSQVCKVCTKCESETGSVVKEECTKETNTKCQCREEFVPWERDSSSCKCRIGFGLQLEGRKCSKCEDGYFTTQSNSQCKKWKECKCGVKTNGTRSSDVICNELQGCTTSNIPTPSANYLTTPPTSNKMVSLIARLTSPHPHERAHTERIPTGTTTTMAAPGHTVTHIGTGLALVILGIIGLRVLTAVTCKLHVTPQPAVPNNDSLCRRPVEESGESSLCSVKRNPGEH
nr:tumor necrosis factor receptor superfamily member 4 isoform X1 [Gasterosteus aculeatus aculeatus]